MRRWTVERWAMFPEGVNAETVLLPERVDHWDIALKVGIYPGAVFVTNPTTAPAFADLLLHEYPVYGHDAVPVGFIFRTNESGWEKWQKMHEDAPSPPPI